MIARERQTEIGQGMIQRSPVGMTLDYVNHLGDESPDTHRFTLGCECKDTLHITLEQGEEGKWVAKTLTAFREHLSSKHKGQAVTA